IVTTYRDQPRGLMVWDVATGKPLRKLEGESDGAVAFSPDGRTVASAFVGRFYLTEVASGKARFQLPLPRHEDRRGSGDDVVERIRFAREGRSVVAISRCDVHVFSTARGSKLLHLSSGEETSSGYWDATGALSPDSRWLAHADRHGSVAV